MRISATSKAIATPAKKEITANGMVLSIAASNIGQKELMTSSALSAFIKGSEARKLLSNVIAEPFD